MFHKLITKYGLATHLALLASLPTAIQPFVSDHTLAVVILWLSGFALLWLFVEPSILVGEHLSTARERVRWDLLKSPLTWLMIFVVAFAAIRWWNDGIALRFNPEDSVWTISRPAMSGLPASVPEAAFLPFAVAAGSSVIVLGVLYGLGLAGRASFGVTFSFVLGLGGLAMAICACSEVEPFQTMAMSGFAAGSNIGTAFGIGCLTTVVCGAYAESRKWSFARLPYCVAVAGNVSGVLFFAPSLVSGAYMLVSGILAVFCLVFMSRVSTVGNMVRSLVMLILGVAIAFSLMIAFAPSPVWELKLQGWDMAQAFPGAYQQLCEVLGRISRVIWKDSPWCGSGIGSFPLQVQFLADKSDWTILPPVVKSAANGYWMVLAERGILGCLLLAGVGLSLLALWIKHLVGAILYLKTKDDAYSFPFACAPVIWIFLPLLVLLCVEAVADPVFSGKTVLPVVVACMALSAASFPRKPRRQAPTIDQEQ